MLQKVSKEHFIISIFIGITILFIQLQYIVGSLNTPADTIYLGTVHWPADYFYYLSQMIQGKEHWLSSTILYTSEKLTPVLVGWQTVLTGKILHLLGFGVIASYQIAVISLLFLFLQLAHILLKKIFPNQKGKRILAFFFFVSSTSLPIFSFAKKGIEWTYYSFWYNTGNIFGRLGPTPHHLLANSLIVAGFLLAIAWFQAIGKKSIWVRVRLMAGMILVGLMLSSITPVQWGLLVISVSAGALYFLWVKTIQPSHFLPGITFFISGLPAAYYVRWVFSIAPYSYSSTWEATQQLPMTPYMLFLGSGLIIPIGILGLYPFFKKMTHVKAIGIILLLLCSLFYFTAIPVSLKLTNARFWPPALYIFLASLATEGVFALAGFFRHRKKLIFVILLAIYIVAIIPSHFAQQREILKPQVGNAFIYLPNDAYKAYQTAEKISSKENIFLVQWPFNESFPALTGRKSFIGFYLLTIDADKKGDMIYKFFDGKMTDEEMKEFLYKYKINYLLGYPWNPKIDKLPFVKRLYVNRLLAIDEVKL